MPFPRTMLMVTANISGCVLGAQPVLSSTLSVDYLPWSCMGTTITKMITDRRTCLWGVEVLGQDWNASSWTCGK